jgi:hypothetical protein
VCDIPYYIVDSRISGKQKCHVDVTITAGVLYIGSRITLVNSVS